MAGIRFDQLRISSTLANAGLESYTDGSEGVQAIRVAAGDGLTRGSGGVFVDGTENYMKEPVRVRSSTNVTISGPGANIDGVAMSVGDRVLLDNQTTTTEDGIWVFQGAASAMTRSVDAPVGADAAGWYIQALEGTQENLYRVDANLGAAIIGTNDISTSVFSGGASRTAGLGLVDGAGDDLDVNTGDGIAISSDRVVAQVSTATAGQQYGGLVRTRNADGSGAGTANAGYLAVATDNSTLGVTAANLVAVQNGGITGTQLNTSVAGNGLAGGGGSALSVDLNELTAAVFDPAADSLPFIDATDSGSKSDAWTDVATAIAGNGVTATTGVLSVDPDSESGGNIEPVTVGANGVGLDVSSIAGTGLEADGSANLRLATQGTGIAGGGGSTLSIDTNSTVDFSASTPVWTFGNETTAEGLFVTGTPVDATHVVNKSYVDSVASGLDIKDSVNTATTQILDSNASISGSPTYSATGGTSARGQITATLAVSDTFTVDGISYGAADDGSRILIKNESSGTAQVHSIDTVADSSGSLNNTFWVFYTTPNFGFYVWYNVNAAGTDPNPTPPAGVTYTGIEVALATNETADNVRSNTQTEIGNADFTNKGGSPGGTGFTNALTLTNAEGGLVTNVADGSAATGFTFGTDTPGTGLGGAANGIYTTTISGTSLTLDRATDFDADIEVTAGTFMFVAEGNSNADSGWVLTTDDPITVGGAAGTPMAFTQFSGAGSITAGIGLTQSGSTVNLGSSTGDVGGINRTANDIAIAEGDGIAVVSSQTAVQVATASAGQQYGGLVVNRTSDGSGAAAAGDGYVAVQTDNSTLGINASNQVAIQALGVDTAQLAANAVTEAKIGFSFREEEFAASAFALSSGNYVVSLTNTAIATVKTYFFNECYRNGVADMTNTGATDPTTATEYRVTASELQIGADITATGDVYRVRYLSSATT